MATKAEKRVRPEFWTKAEQAVEKHRKFIESVENPPPDDEEERILDIVREEQEVFSDRQTKFRFTPLLEWEGNVPEYNGDLVARSIVSDEDYDPVYYAIRFLPKSLRFVVNCPGIMPEPKFADTIKEAKDIAQGYEDDLLDNVGPRLPEPKWPEHVERL